MRYPLPGITNAWHYHHASLQSSHGTIQKSASVCSIAYFITPCAISCNRNETKQKRLIGFHVRSHLEIRKRRMSNLIPMTSLLHHHNALLNFPSIASRARAQCNTSSSYMPQNISLITKTIQKTWQHPIRKGLQRWIADTTCNLFAHFQPALLKSRPYIIAVPTHQSST